MISSARNGTPASRRAALERVLRFSRLSAGLKILPTAVSGISPTMRTCFGRAARSAISRRRNSASSAPSPTRLA